MAYGLTILGLYGTKWGNTNAYESLVVKRYGRDSLEDHCGRIIKLDN
jgi:hypothetical protein